MRIAFVMKNYCAPSELWLQRQIEMLQDQIAFIAVLDNHKKAWRGIIPVVSLKYRPIYKRLLAKFGFIKKESITDRYCKRLSAALFEHQADVVFVQYLSVSHDLKSLLLDINLPIVIHTHGYDITWDLKSRDTGEKIYNNDYIEFARVISQKATYIANSEYSKNKIQEIGIPPSKVVVKRFGVPLEGAKPIIRKTAGVKILYLGRLIEVKAPDLVIKAFELACNNGLDGELIIAGGGNLEGACKELRERSKYKEKIKLLGYVSAEEGIKLRSMCDIFTAHNCKSTATNQEEAFGVSIIEAMSAGLPVVTGRSGGVVDSIIDGVTGFLITPGDIEEHADKLLELATNPGLRAAMGGNAVKRIQDYFSLEGEKQSLINILKKAANQ